MLQTCTRCNRKEKQTYKVTAAPKTSADLCSACYNAWFDLRDKLVSEAFHTFVKDKSHK